MAIGRFVTDSTRNDIPSTMDLEKRYAKEIPKLDGINSWELRLATMSCIRYKRHQFIGKHFDFLFPKCNDCVGLKDGEWPGKSVCSVVKILVQGKDFR